jgi:ubiquinone/menaquinone biosynthesis C-methylase UbiE
MTETTASTFVSPAKLVQFLDIPRGSIVADLGAGSGFYTIPLAEKVGPEGKVYAFDVQLSAVSRIQSLAHLRHLLNIDAVVADLELDNATHLKEGVCDAVLIASVLHQVENPLAVLKEARRILKPGRLMIFIEWDQSSVPGGPLLSMRISPDKAKELGQTAGFLFDREVSAGSHHYGLLFQKR